MLRLLHRVRARLSDERGITLIETLVAAVTGVIVAGALFSILEFSLKESTRISDVAQATQLGRGTMNRIVDELHSGCLSPKFAPIRSGSKVNKMILISAYGSEAELATSATTKAGIRKDEIEYSPGAGTLTDTYKLSTGVETSGEYKWGTAVKVKIGEHITSSVAAKPEQIFTYYKYYTRASTGTTTPASTLTEKAPPSSGEFTTAESAEIAAVMVQFNTAPTDNKGSLGRSVDLNTLTTLAFTAPDSENPIIGGPCE